MIQSINVTSDNELMTLITNLEPLANWYRRHPETVIYTIAKHLQTTTKRGFIVGYFTDDQMQRAFNKFLTSDVICPKCYRVNTTLDIFHQLQCFECDNPSIIRMARPMAIHAGETLQLASLPEDKYSAIHKSLTIMKHDTSLYVTNRGSEEIILQPDTPVCVLH